MCWEAIAAVAATTTVVLTVYLFIIKPRLIESKRKTPLSRLADLKVKAVNLQNKNKDIDLSNEEFKSF
jgi:hypothetical protein